MRSVRLEGWGGRPVSGAWVYILRCADDTYYVGSTRANLERRIAEHNAGHHGGYMLTRRPVMLLFSQHFAMITDAIAAERRIKGWSRAKKEALIADDWTRISALSQRRGPHPLRRRHSTSKTRVTVLMAPPQDEEKR